MLKLTVTQPTEFSKAQLVLRSLFGAVYLAIPHAMMIVLYGIVAQVLGLLSAISILFTGNKPLKWHQFHKSFLNYASLVHMRVYNLADGYPSFSLNQHEEWFKLEAPYLETQNRLSVLLRLLFGPIYVLLPHVFVWGFRNAVSSILTFLAFWVVLFTGNYPAPWYNFNIGTLRWILRVQAYMLYLTDDYPPFSGRG